MELVKSKAQEIEREKNKNTIPTQQPNQIKNIKSIILSQHKIVHNPQNHAHSTLSKYTTTNNVAQPAKSKNSYASQSFLANKPASPKLPGEQTSLISKHYMRLFWI
jgi:hypothetical protein